MKAAALLAVLLTGCAPAVTVRAPICETPPLPAEVWIPCPPPQPLSDGELRTFYLQSYVDAATIGCWASRVQNIKEKVEHRDAKVKECQEQATKAKSWWQ